jgi:subtilisin family serine protease
MISNHCRALAYCLSFVIGVFPAFAVAAGPTAPDGLSVPDSVVADILNAKAEEKTYVVWMDGDPLVAYDGDIKGLKATRPGKGKKLNPKSKAVINYQAHLHARQNAAMQGVGIGSSKKLYNYSVTFNGFAAKMTDAQAEQLRASADVRSVVEDRKYRFNTVSTPEFLGLRDSGSAWDLGYQGEDVVIGIMDSGIWPENPSFSDRTGTNPNGKPGKLDYHQIPGWNGKCVPGEDFNASHCNQKLIAAQWYSAGFGGDGNIKNLFPYEFVSPRAADGHGVHTASTAGGNDGVEAVVDGVDLGTASGMAPRARIAAYKVCWGFGDDPAGGCFGSDSVAAIDQAVIDGVDVINFSISGTRTNFLDAVEVAFLFAADAGVFVAASAGNSGPGAETVAHPSPWITTVAAGTHDRLFEADVVLGNGDSYTGASIQETGTAVLPMVYSADVGLPGEDPNEVRLCYPGTLDPAAVSGTMVLCDRGLIARVSKSAAVSMAGGSAMVLANVGPGSLNADLHSVPSVHVASADGDAIRSYVTTDAAPTGYLTPRISGTNPSAPEVAAFSSRGPLLASSDLLKPDIMAPGVDILAAVSPIEGGRDFDFLSGTSMSSPHIAGLAAVVKSAHPDWSPMMIKSALMTSSDDTAASPFAEGTGHVVPNSAIDPGLVYDSGFLDWLGFLCGTGQLAAGFCPALGIDPSDLNGPNIAVGELAGAQTVTRTVTNVGSAASYVASVDAPPGIDVSVSPGVLTLAAGESASYEVTFESTASSVIGDYAFGNLTWSDGAGHDVRSALVVRPLAIAAPDQVSLGGSSGSASFDVTFGYDGAYTAAAHGLEPATQQAGSVDDDPANDINTALGTCDFGSFPFACTGITWHLVFVPPAPAHTRISLFDAYTDGNDDLDLYVWDAGFGFVGSSGSGTSAEQVDIALPSSPFYFVAVHGWQTDGPDANYVLFDWSVPGTPGGTYPLIIDSAPGSASVAVTDSIEFSWDVSGDSATSGRKYLGAISHSDAGGVIGLTLVNVDDD